MAAFFAGPNQVNFDDFSKFWDDATCKLFANTVVAAVRFIKSSEVSAADRPGTSTYNTDLVERFKVRLAAPNPYFYDMSRLPSTVPAHPKKISDKKKMPSWTALMDTAWSVLKARLDTQYIITTANLDLLATETTDNRRPPPAQDWWPFVPLLEHLFYKMLKEKKDTHQFRRLSYSGRFFGSGANVFCEDGIVFHDRPSLCGLPAAYWYLEEHAKTIEVHVPPTIDISRLDAQAVRMELGELGLDTTGDDGVLRVRLMHALKTDASAPPDHLANMLRMENVYAALPVWDMGQIVMHSGTRELLECAPPMLKELAIKSMA